jgi:uncharacterized glyoxalase superfamily protein PhnB
VVDVYPSLTYRDLDAAVEFLNRAFGFALEETVADESGKLRLVTMRHGSGRVLLQPDLPDELHGSHVGRGWVYVAVSDADAHFSHAVTGGAEVLGGPHNALGGAQRGYSARDPEGNRWRFGVDRPDQ